MFGAKRLVEWGCGAALAAALASCATLPSWTGLTQSEETAALAPVTYPDLSEIPDRPAVLPDPADRRDIVQSLLEDRALTAQAAESLRREIETSFETPVPPPGP